MFGTLGKNSNKANFMLDLISAKRLNSYATILKTKNQNESLRAYYWNKALAASLYPALQCLEITLRNAIDIAIRNNPPSGGLYTINNWWFTNLSCYMGDKKIPKSKRRDANNVIKKKIWEEEQIEKVIRGFNKKSISYDASKIIAGLDFGFWTNLLSNNYEDTGSSTLLWPNLLPQVFPYAPSGITRQKIQEKMDRVREFRNRISHHEPVWKFYYSQGATIKPDYTRPVFGRAASISLLSQQFDEIMELIGWIDKDRHDYLKKSKVCALFGRICNEAGFQAYLSPNNISTMNISKSTKVRHVAKKIKKGEIFSLVKNKSIVAIIGVDIPFD